MSDKIYDTIALDTIEKLAQIVADKNLGEITIADGDQVITVKGKKCPPPMMGGMPMAMPQTPAEPQPTQFPAATSAMPEAPKGHVVKAPIVGTFYAAPAPDQPPFVQVGDTVKKGDVILIIESMKLMNEVTSEVDGVVQEILVQNGQAVEYDQPLMILA